MPRKKTCGVFERIPHSSAVVRNQQRAALCAPKQNDSGISLAGSKWCAVPVVVGPNGQPLPSMAHGRNLSMPMIPMTPFTPFGGQMWNGPSFGFHPAPGHLQSPATPHWMPAPSTPGWIPTPSSQNSTPGSGTSVPNSVYGFGTIGAASEASLPHPSSSTGASSAPSLEEQLQDLPVTVQASARLRPSSVSAQVSVHAPAAPTPASPPRAARQPPRSSQYFPYTPPTEQQRRRQMLVEMEHQKKSREHRKEGEDWEAEWLRGEKELKEEEEQQDADRRQTEAVEAAEIEERRKEKKKENLMLVDKMKDEWRIKKGIASWAKMTKEDRLELAKKELDFLRCSSVPTFPLVYLLLHATTTVIPSP
ncbi:Protein CBG26214 [Caenorhabditis briggsae]|uniref:Protein CBG26214 n=1 Tax=Caenorhabditis briggsae TaxID=6238 RepID=B6ILV9_CAEBR|nr:Protein CBG26214 [Caenorhabditis briggsae]CAS00889.1 Protein CBG26214 [Caenorhabditis briggsae]